MSEETKSKRVSMSKRKLAEKAEELEVAAIVTSVEGAQLVSQGEAELRAAGEVAAVGAAELAKGASDLTRAVDAEIVADRMARLSKAVEVAGVVDVAEGAEMLAASEDVGVMSALVGLMSYEDAEHGLELARLAGELEAVSQVVEGLQMPMLYVFLSARSERLQEMAVEQIRQAGSTRGLARAMAATGKQLAGMGENEVAEGLARMAVSEGMADRSAELALGGEMLAERGVEELATASAAGVVARIMVAEGTATVEAGAAELGAAAAAEGFAGALEEKAN